MICENCRNYQAVTLKFKTKVMGTDRVVEKEATFPKRCIYGYKEAILGLTEILKCSLFETSRPQFKQTLCT